MGEDRIDLAADGHVLANCTTIKVGEGLLEKVLHVSFLVQEEIDYAEEFFNELKEIIDLNIHNEGDLRDFIEEFLAMEKDIFCMLVHDSNSSFHHVDIDENSCDCSDKCYAENLVLQELNIMGEDRIDLAADGHVLANCTTIKVGEGLLEKVLHVSFLVQEEINYEEEFLKELRKYLSQEDYKDEKLLKRIGEFLALGKDRLCIVVHDTEKEIYHVDIDTNSCDCADTCYNEDIVLENLLKDSDKVQLYEVDHSYTNCVTITVGDIVLHVSFLVKDQIDYVEEFLKELRKHLYEEDYDDDLLKAFIHDFLKHDKDHFCIVVHASDKKLHHVNIDTNSCGCDDTCYNEHIVLENMKAELVYEEDHSLSDCITITVGEEEEEKVLYVSFLTENKVDYLEEFLIELRQYLSPDDYSDAYLIKFIQEFLDLELESHCFVAHQDKSSLHHVLIEKNACDCENTCYNENILLEELLEDGTSQLLDEPLSSYSDCVTIMVGDKRIFLSFLTTDPVDYRSAFFKELREILSDVHKSEDIYIFIDQFLGLNKDRLCMIVHDYATGTDKKLYHVDIDVDSCDCNDTCYSKDIRFMDLLSPADVISLDGHSISVSDCKSIEVADKILHISFTVRDTFDYLNGFFDELRAAGVTEEIIIDEDLYEIIQQLLDLDKKDTCIVVNHHKKMLHHVDFDKESCSCESSCSSKDLILTDMYGNHIEAAYHTLQDCVSIELHDKTMHLNHLKPILEYPLIKGLFEELRVYLDLHRYSDEEIYQFIEQLLDREGNEHCGMDNQYTGRLHHMDKYNNHCDCADTCNTESVICSDLYTGEDLAEPGYKVSLCKTINVLDMILHMNSLVPSDIDLDDDGTEDNEAYDNIIKKLKLYLYNFSLTDIETEVREAIALIKRDKSDYALVANFKNYVLQHVDMTKSIGACEHECSNEYRIMYEHPLHGGRMIEEVDHVYTRCLHFDIGINKLYVHLYEKTEMKALNELDENNDGVYEAEEIIEVIEDPKLVDEITEALDGDGDGIVTKEDMITTDLNNDGMIDIIEAMVAANEDARLELLAALFATEYSILKCSMQYLLSKLNMEKLHELLDNFDGALLPTELHLGDTTLHSLQLTLGELQLAVGITLTTNATQLNEAIQTQNKCYHDKVGNLIFEHLSKYYDKEHLYHYFVTCDGDPNLCKFNADPDKTYQNIKYLSYEREEVEYHSCLTCKSLNDLQVSSLHGDDDLDNHKCGDHVEEFDKLILIKFNEDYHLISLKCGADSTMCDSIKHS